MSVCVVLTKEQKEILKRVGHNPDKIISDLSLANLIVDEISEGDPATSSVVSIEDAETLQDQVEQSMDLLNAIQKNLEEAKGQITDPLKNSMNQFFVLRQNFANFLNTIKDPRYRAKRKDTLNQMQTDARRYISELRQKIASTDLPPYRVEFILDNVDDMVNAVMGKWMEYDTTPVYRSLSVNYKSEVSY